MTPQKSISGRAWVEMVLLALIWGGTFMSAALALREMPVITIVAHRVFWAMIILWIYVFWRRIPLPRSPATWGAFLVMGLLNNAIPFLLFVWSQQFITTGLVSILNSATAISGVVVAAIVFRDESLSPRKIIGVLIGFVGVSSTIGIEHLLAFDPHSTAQLAILLAAMCYALASAWARKTLSHLPSEVAAAGMLTGSSLIMVPAALLIDGVPSTGLSLQTILALAFYSVIATAFAYLLFYRILKMAGSGNLMLVTLLIPPFAILLGAIVLHETLRQQDFIGFGLIALGLIVLDGRA